MDLNLKEIISPKNNLIKQNKTWDNLFPYVITFLFLLVSAYLIKNHEMWRDEMTGWLVGADSSSLPEFFSKIKDNQGHPALWSLIMYLISHYISPNPEIMKVVHLIISTSTAFLILKFSPFNKIIKTSLVFSYFLFYEYSIISRNYALGIIFIFLFCVLYKNRKKNLLLISLVILLMGQGSIYSFVISIACFIYLLIDIVIFRKDYNTKKDKVNIVISIIIFLISIFLIYIQLGSLAINGNVFSKSIFAIFNNSWEYFLNSLKLVIEGIIKTFLNIPKFSINFWESNLLVDFLKNNNIFYSFLISFILVLLPIFILKRRVLILYFLGLVLVIFIPLFIYKGTMRHYGHLFILFFSCLWISEIESDNRYLIKIRNNKNFVLKNIYIFFILTISIYTTFTAFYFDSKYYFSSGQAVAKKIKENFNVDDYVFIGYQDTSSELISGFLDKPFYYPQSLKANKFSKLISWTNRKGEIGINEVISDSFDFLINKEKIILVISNPKEGDMEELEKFYFNNIYNNDYEKNIVDDNYYLYSFDNQILEYLIIEHYNFLKFWNLNSQCNISDDHGYTSLIVNGDDPSMESNFLIENEYKNIIIFDNFFSCIDAEMEIYYKLKNKTYNETNKEIVKISKGENDYCIAIPNDQDIEKIRIDPINIKSNCKIDRIIFLVLK